MIIPEVTGLELRVVVDNGLATEHAYLYQTSRTSDSETSNGIPTKQCYIESKTDSAYSIKYIVSQTFELPKDVYALVFSLHVDGEFFAGKCVYREMLEGENDYVKYISDRTATAVDGIHYFEHLVFQDLSSYEGADGKTVDRETKRLCSMGEIRVEVSFAKRSDVEVKRHRVGERSKISDPLLRFSYKARIKSDSAIQHGTYYKRTAKNKTPKTRSVKINSHHLVGVYRFHYRPYDTLVSRGVIARDPHHIRQPYPSSKASEVIDLTDEKQPLFEGPEALRLGSTSSSG